MPISVIVPLHNEGSGLREFFETFLTEADELITQHEIQEILLIENGSRDETFDKALLLEKMRPALIKVFQLGFPSYGAALRCGISNARSEFLSVLECDCLNVTFLRESLQIFQSEKRFIVASKGHPASNDRRPILRRMMTYNFNRLLRILTGYRGTDTRGPKSIDTALAQRLDNLALTSDEAYQTELVLLAWKLGVTIVELPITIAEQREAPIPPLSRVPKTLSIFLQLMKSLSRDFDSLRMEGL